VKKLSNKTKSRNIFFIANALVLVSATALLLFFNKTNSETTSSNAITPLSEAPLNTREEDVREQTNVQGQLTESKRISGRYFNIDLPEGWKAYESSFSKPSVSTTEVTNTLLEPVCSGNDSDKTAMTESLDVTNNEVRLTIFSNQCSFEGFGFDGFFDVADTAEGVKQTLTKSDLSAGCDDTKIGISPMYACVNDGTYDFYAYLKGNGLKGATITGKIPGQTELTNSQLDKILSLLSNITLNTYQPDEEKMIVYALEKRGIPDGNGRTVVPTNIKIDSIIGSNAKGTAVAGSGFAFIAHKTEYEWTIISVGQQLPGSALGEQYGLPEDWYSRNY
jgi:hypothetical protein